MSKEGREARLSDDTGFTLAPRPRFDIVRFFKDERPTEVVQSGVTLDQAQAHCQDPTTKGEGWFDGYRKAVE